MKHIFLNTEETLNLIIDYVNEPKNSLDYFKYYIKDIAKTNKISLKQLRQIYRLKNKKIEYELLKKYSKEYFNIDIVKLSNCKNVNNFIKNYISVLNTNLLEFNCFKKNLNQISIKNWILLLEYSYDYDELDTLTELLINNTTVYKLQRIQKHLDIFIDKNDFESSYKNIKEYFSA